MTFPRKAAASFTLLALVAAIAVELVRATGPMFDRAFSAGIVVVALTALGTYVAPGLVAASSSAAARSPGGRSSSVSRCSRSPAWPSRRREASRATG